LTLKQGVWNSNLRVGEIVGTYVSFFLNHKSFQMSAHVTLSEFVPFPLMMQVFPIPIKDHLCKFVTNVLRADWSGHIDSYFHGDGPCKIWVPALTGCYLLGNKEKGAGAHSGQVGAHLKAWVIFGRNTVWDFATNNLVFYNCSNAMCFTVAFEDNSFDCSTSDQATFMSLIFSNNFWDRRLSDILLLWYLVSTVVPKWWCGHSVLLTFCHLFNC